MALDGEESTPVPNLALETIVKPALREVSLIQRTVWPWKFIFRVLSRFLSLAILGVVMMDCLIDL